MNKEEIEKEIHSRLDKLNNQRDSIFNNGYSQGFSDAVEWRINSVWHDVGDRSIIIDNNEEVVLLLENGKIIEYDDDWEQYCCLVLKWAYKSDLTPTKKNNIWTT